MAVLGPVDEELHQPCARMMGPYYLDTNLDDINATWISH